MAFSHLHLHTDHSVLDSIVKVIPLIKKTKELGQSSLAITDHGTLSNLYKFYTECKKNNVKPILGCEVYFAFDIEDKIRPYHLTILVQNKEGLNNLIKLNQFAQTIGFYYKPRITWDKLKECSNGLIAMTGCLGSPFNQLIQSRQISEVEDAFGKFKDVFNERFFIEIHNHKIVDQISVNEELLRLSKMFDVIPVAANDVHYLNKDDAYAQDVSFAVGTKNLVSNPDRPRLLTQEFYFKSEEEMLLLHKKAHVENTQIVVDIVDCDIEKKTFVLPQYPPKELQNRLIKAVQNIELTDIQRERIREELDIIEEANLSDYLLTVADYVNYANDNGMFTGPGRGSVAGSYVGYLLGIHFVDPIKYDLLFSRFYNRGRIGSLPDIDIDFSIKDIDSMRIFLEKKYGRFNVAMIGTFNTMSGRSAIKAVCRALDVPFSLANQYTKLFGKETVLEDALEIGSVQRLYKSDEGFKNIFNTAIKLEGCVYSESIHAAGIVVSTESLIDIIPTRIDKNTGMLVSSWDMKDLEDMGLLKFDFLRLATLDIIDDTIQQIPKLNSYHDIPENDKKTFLEIRKGNNVGVFQLSSEGISRLAEQIKPKSIEDLAVVVALYRPGPLESQLEQRYIRRKFGKEFITYKHPKLKNSLEKTYGIPIYQENVTRILIDLAGFTEHEADHVRKVIGKKLGKAEMDKIGKEFIHRCINNDIEESIAEDIWNDIQYFAAYSFNFSHSVSYAYLTYYTAYLKTHYPKEFLTACLNNSLGKTEKVARFIREGFRLGIQFLPPTVGKAHDFFTSEKKGIRVGYAAIHAVGFGAENKISCESIESFMTDSEINSNAIMNIIACGGFDEWNVANRNSLVEHFKKIKTRKKNNKTLSLSGDEEIKYPNVKITKKEIIRTEFNLIGEVYSVDVFDLPWFKENEFDEEYLESCIAHRTKVKLGGIITDIKFTETKKEKLPMAIFNLHSPIGYHKILCFPNEFVQSKDKISEGEMVSIIGDIKEEDDSVTIIAKYILLIE